MRTMNPGSRLMKGLAVAVVASMPLLGLAGVASAKAAHGCKKAHSCQSGGGTGTGTGTGASDPTITVQIDPNPVVETGQSNVNVIVQVETSPSYAGDFVSISSSQLAASCSNPGTFLSTEQPSGPSTYANVTYSVDSPLSVALDDDGNATIWITGLNCAPGTDVVDASMTAAPYLTAIGTLTVSPPVVTTAGVSGYPTDSGTVTTGEVETGDTAASGNSDVYAVFYVETDPVYAEQTAEISDNQLQDSCGGGFVWYFSDGDNITGPDVTETLDDDGNAVFVFVGSSCAATTTDVVADILAGSHPTYTSTFTVDAPAPTI
jgi:hypothetical protein